MKKALLIVLLLLFSFPGMAQQELLDQDWKLHYMIIDGVTIDVPQYHPSNPEYDPSILFSETTEGYEIFAIIDFNYFFDQGTIINPDNFILQEPGVTLGDCNYCQLELEYLSIILFGNGGDQRTIDYEIIEEPDNKKTLVLTTPEGNTAVHGNYILSANEFDKPRIALYPNPSNDIVFITSENMQIESLSIFDISGKQLMNVPYTDNAMDVSGLPAGMYFLEIDSENGKAIKQFIKK